MSKESQPFMKYVPRHDGDKILHVVARKGGLVIYTLCGESFLKAGTHTLTRVPNTHHVCTNCAEVMR